MMYLASFVLVIISSGIGSCSPSLGENKVLSCGDMKCTSKNSPFNDVLKSVKDLPKPVEGEYVCVDLVVNVPDFRPTDNPCNPTGLMCKTDENGNTAVCNEKNSKLPDDLKTDAILQTKNYVCLDVVYEIGKPNKIRVAKQCAFQSQMPKLCEFLENQNKFDTCYANEAGLEPTCRNEKGDTVTCSEYNSKLPKDINTDGITKTLDYVCLDAVYETGDTSESKHVMQCAFQSKDPELCEFLKSKNQIKSCTAAEPETKFFCYMNDQINFDACNEENSKLPVDLNTTGLVQTEDYVCLDAKYEFGGNLKVNHVMQCAFQSQELDLCKALKTGNKISKCKAVQPVPTYSKPDKSDERFQTGDLSFTDQCSLKYGGDRDICDLLKEALGEANIDHCSAKDTSGADNFPRSSSFCTVLVFCVYIFKSFNW